MVNAQSLSASPPICRLNLCLDRKGRSATVRAQVLAGLGWACGILLFVHTTAPTYAAQINLGASGCQVTFAPSDQIEHARNRVQTTFSSQAAQVVACNVPRSTPGGFGVLVDGANFTGAPTSCTLFTFDDNGNLVR